MKLRPARPDDVLALTKIMHTAKASWGYPEELMSQWRQHWTITPDHLTELDLIVAEDNGRPVAFSGGKTSGNRTFDLEYLYVAPDRHGKGAGALLLRRCEDRARQLGCEKMALRSEVNAGGFYERHGYDRVGQEPSQMAPGRFMPLMERQLTETVFPVSNVALSLSAAPWDFETENPEPIAAHFAEKQRQIPELWNGRTLKLTAHSFKGGVLTGQCTECSYAAFLTWRDWGAPDLTTFNLFGSAVIRSSEGALLYGVMSPHTATAGLVYPPGGNLDPSDVSPNGSIDIHGSIARELEEETGLTAETLVRGQTLIVFDGPRISVAQVFDSNRPADDLRTDMIAHSKASEEQELADIRIIRQAEDLMCPEIVPYARDLGRYLFG